MTMKPVVRLHLFFARDCEKAVILRQGPTEVCRMIAWDRATDTFEDGQWLKHKIYVDRCDLSPDGKHFLYFTHNSTFGAPGYGAFSAISRPPYFTALALFPEGSTWGGGGRFLDGTHFYADGDKDIIGRTKGLTRLTRVEASERYPEGLALPNGKPFHPKDRDDQRAGGRKAVANPLDRYDTQGGRLYRREAGDMALIRDFTDMEFEHIRAPYDWRDDKEPGSPKPWHPLDRDTP